MRDSIISRVSLLVVSLASATSSAEQLYMCSLSILLSAVLASPPTAALLVGAVELVGREVRVSIGNLSQVEETMQLQHVYVT